MQYAKSSVRTVGHNNYVHHFHCRVSCWQNLRSGDRKSTRLNSSHDQISYAVFCLKKKTEQELRPPERLPAHPISNHTHWTDLRYLSGSPSSSRRHTFPRPSLGGPQRIVVQVERQN